MKYVCKNKTNQSKSVSVSKKNSVLVNPYTKVNVDGDVIGELPVGVSIVGLLDDKPVKKILKKVENITAKLKIEPREMVEEIGAIVVVKDIDEIEELNGEDKEDETVPRKKNRNKKSRKNN